MAERQSCKLKVLGSIPSGGLIHAGTSTVQSDHLRVREMYTLPASVMRKVWSSGDGDSKFDSWAGHPCPPPVYPQGGVSCRRAASPEQTYTINRSKSCEVPPEEAGQYVLKALASGGRGVARSKGIHDVSACDPAETRT